jgi:putative ABC transport system permease protein
MRTGNLILRNLIFFRHTNLAIVAGVAIAVGVLAGALQIGESVRGSLRDLLFERIGSTEYVVASPNFFSEDLSTSISSGFESSPIIYLKGIVTNADTRVRAHDVNVYGIDERFWKLQRINAQTAPEERAALVGSSLARQLNLRAGATFLLQVETQQAIPREWLYGRRESIGKTIRLNCREVLTPDRLGEFTLRPTQGNVYSLFVPLQRLQRDLQQPSRVNTVLLRSSTAIPVQSTAGATDSLRDMLKRRCTLADLGLKLRNVPENGAFSVESNRILLDDTLAKAASLVAASTGAQSSPLYTYLANSIRANGREIPYSVITAADLGKGALGSISVTGATNSSPAASREEMIWLTEWAAHDLGASIGDPVEVDYYLWQDSGRLVTRTARFRLAGIVSNHVDASFAPDIPGITEAQSMNTWDPPFPLDLGRIRKEDEDFWNRYKATPKAFIPLTEGQKLWDNRFGKLTALRISPPDESHLVAFRNRFTAALLERMDPQQFGFAVTAVKEQGLSASRGSTDFGEYFVYFSSFLIAAAVMISALFFRLMIEQRVREIGILQTAGYTTSSLHRIFLCEGIVLSITGSIVGVFGSIGYACLMIYGLRTWWVGAVGTRRLTFHLAWNDLCVGAVTGMIFSIIAILWTLRGLRRNSPRMLLAGVLESAAARMQRSRTLSLSAAACTLASLVLLALSASGTMPQIEGFFGSGFLLLIAILCATARYLRRRDHHPVQGNGWPAQLRLALRNATHRPGRSVICASLIASATFIILSMEAFRQDTHSVSLEPASGTGGYPLLAESALPITHDLNSDAGREATGLSTLQGEDIADIKFTAFRERPGDDASCLNLYAPREPKILGAPLAFLAAGRFSFQPEAQNAEGKRNPWVLLESSPTDPVIPAIADANTIQYILHLSVGSEIVVRADNGAPVRMRLVAALKDSLFQGELLISESNFVRAFPQSQGYRFFLLDLPRDRASSLRIPLQEALADWGFNVESSQERLSNYHRVENTYLSTFQSLGALGLVLGTLGLATMLLRNVLERRQELALLRAVGYRKRVLSNVILLENLLLVCWGLVSGSICASLAIIPAMQSRGGVWPLAGFALIVALVLATGLLSSLAAVIAALRSPLLSSLQTE